MNKKNGILIIHGFAGTIDDIEPLNKFLLDKGFTTICVKLKGHTGNREDLIKTNYNHWIHSAEKSFVELLGKCKKIIIIGFSMGGLIAVNIALKYKVLGIITLSTPIYHWDMRRICINIIKDFRTGTFENLKHYKKAIIRIPFLAMINFKILLMKTKPLFKKIEYPIFITQGMLDDTVHYKSAEYIYSKVSSKQKKIKYYKNSKHTICKDNDKNEVFDDILMFVSCISL